MNKSMRARKAWKVYQETKKLICEERLMNMNKMNVKIIEHKKQEFQSLFQQPEIKAMVNVTECEVGDNHSGNIVILPTDFNPFAEDVRGTWSSETSDDNIKALGNVIKCMKLIYKQTDGYPVTIDFSNIAITPYALSKMLGSVGYEQYDSDRNGWEGDYWLEYRKNIIDYGNWLPNKLTIEGTSMTSFLALTLDGEES